MSAPKGIEAIPFDIKLGLPCAVLTELPLKRALRHQQMFVGRIAFEQLLDKAKAVLSLARRASEFLARARLIKKDPSNKWKMFKVDFLSSSKGPLAFK